jgi:hypothetical protein
MNLANLGLKFGPFGVEAVLAVGAADAEWMLEDSSGVGIDPLFEKGVGRTMLRCNWVTQRSGSRCCRGC